MIRMLLSMVLLGVWGCGAGSTQTFRIDQILHRTDFRHGTLGPTGKRLFTERLDKGLGLRGRFCYIHHSNIGDPLRLKLIQDDRELTLAVEQVDWYPSHLAVRWSAGPIGVQEYKYITDDDTLIDQVTLTNNGIGPIECILELSSSFAAKPKSVQELSNHCLVGSDEFYGVRAYGMVVGEGFTYGENDAVLMRSLRLERGKPVNIPVAMSMAENAISAERTAKAWIKRPNALQEHRAVYQQWFNRNCPQFECDDPYITKLYWYRWFVARHCLSRAATGNLPEPYFFEGTHQSHFPRLIAFSSPHIISEVRWLRDPRYAFGQVISHCRNADDEYGFFISTRINRKGGEYNNWIAKSAWEAFWIHPDRGRLEEIIDKLARDVLGTLAKFDTDGDKLPTPKNHWTTGMEFQPAFFFFNDYDNTKPDAPLERGDFAAYIHGNAKAVAEAYRFLGKRKQTDRFEQIADEIRRSCLAKMWDKNDSFCYAIRESDDAIARCKEIVGFYPFVTGLFPNRPSYTAAMRYLIDPNEFWVPFPPATVTRKCPAYTPKIETWPAAGGRTHGCMWNGPNWPHATSLMLDVVATVIQNYDQPYVKPEHFWHMLERYTHLQFEDDDLNRPYITEYYNSDTGEPDPNGCPDYFHSTYCDLIIKYVVGLQPTNSEELV
ncbi:MAG: hypothetical protein JSV03_08445, partial [Planctomycetota bacterium]